jgi:hypothetical protein
MGIWDGGQDTPLARLIQTLIAQRGGTDVPYIEPPGPGMPRPNTELPFSSAADIAAMGGGHVAGRSGGSAEGALSSLLGMTGIPDIQAGAQAMGRGEYLPGFGQAAFGFGSLGALGAPVARGALMAGREALGAVPGVLADTRGAIRAFHGSPYDFDRFDMSKIGTGEGAQAYGHGLYLAESEPVAETYRFLGQPAYAGPVAARHALRAMREAARNGLTGDDAITFARNDLNDFAKNAGNTLLQREYYDAANNLESIVKAAPGKMYEARINADPEHFLDWDKPLSQQSERVREAIEPLLSEAMTAKLAEGKTRLDAGSDLYSAVSRRIADMSNAETRAKFGERGLYGDLGKLTAESLRDAGIPGIRYLDQGSRGAGEGTHNYVLFSDDIVEIIKKYGLAGLMGTPAAAFSLDGGRDAGL